LKSLSGKRSKPVPFPHQADSDEGSPLRIQADGSKNEDAEKLKSIEIERLKAELARQKKSVLISKEVIFSAKPGEIHKLKWTVQNQSTQAWSATCQLREETSLIP
jgi:hypothetical protein